MPVVYMRVQMIFLFSFSIISLFFLCLSVLAFFFFFYRSTLSIFADARVVLMFVILVFLELNIYIISNFFLVKTIIQVGNSFSIN